MSRPVKIDDTRSTQLRQIVAEFFEFRIGQRCVLAPTVGHRSQSSIFAVCSPLLDPVCCISLHRPLAAKRREVTEPNTLRLDNDEYG